MIMYDYQTLIAVPVSDTQRRPLDGETVIALFADGAAALPLRYVEDNGPVMFDVPSGPAWVDPYNGNAHNPTHWLQGVAHAEEVDTPDYPHLRTLIRRRVSQLAVRGHALNLRNIVRQFDGADRVSAVPDADLPRLYEALGDYEAEAFKL